MNHPLEVDVDELRRAAAGVDGAAAGVAGAAGSVPDPPAAPRWVAADAAALVAGAARQVIAQLGEEIAETARRIVAVAGEYELSDGRAAARLRWSR